jgi:hypothetical protein
MLFKKPPKPNNKTRAQQQTLKTTIPDTEMNRDSREFRVSSSTPAKQRLNISRRNSEQSGSRRSELQLIEEYNSRDINYKMEPDINDSI